jgi:hypothetical protein
MKRKLGEMPIGSSLRVALQMSRDTVINESSQVSLVPVKNKKSKFKGSAPSALRYYFHPNNALYLWMNENLLNRKYFKYTSLLQTIPIEILLEAIEYLSVLDMCHFRSTCHVAWICVCYVSFENAIFPLCQGSFDAICSPVSMMSVKEFEDCGILRPKWNYDHNHACQVRNV